MRGDDAKQVCPEIQLVQVPVARGKADLTAYRNAGSEVVSILARKGRCERASIDEVYLDLTEAAEAMLSDTPEILEAVNEEALKSHVLGLDGDDNHIRDTVKNWLTRRDADHRDKLLACGALIVAELRLQVLDEAEFTCSAGIAHNKMLAKLASGLNKPAQQTVVPFSSVKRFLGPLPIKKMKQLGGKLGTSLQTDLGVHTVGDLLKFSEGKLQEHYGINTGTWLWNIARGISGDEVQGRLLPKSHGSGKSFPGPRALRTVVAVENWLKQLCAELNDRLNSDMEQNKRIAQTFTLHVSAFKVSDSDSVKKFPSKSCPLRYGVSKMQEDALMLFQAALREYLGPCKLKASGNQFEGWGITGLSVSASKILSIPSGTRSITNYFSSQDHSCPSLTISNDKFIHEAQPVAPSGGGNDSCMLEPAIELINAGNRKEYAVTDSDQEHDRVMWKEKDVFVATSFQDQNPLVPLLNPEGDEFRKENLLSGAGADSCPGPNCSESERVYAGNDTQCAAKSEEQEVKSSNEKEGSSILRFFRKQSTCLSNREHVQESEASSSSVLGAESHLKTNRCSVFRKDGPHLNNTILKSFYKTHTDALGQDEQSSTRSYRSSTLSYRIDEIDPVVLNELPTEIQEEVRAWLRPQKRANVAKRGSSIAHYFLPTKES